MCAQQDQRLAVTGPQPLGPVCEYLQVTSIKRFPFVKLVSERHPVEPVTLQFSVVSAAKRTVLKRTPCLTNVPKCQRICISVQFLT